MSIRTDVTLADLFRAMPARACLHTLAPLLVAAAQLTNGYLHGGSLLYPALFGAVMVVFSALVTRYHMLELRTARLERTWLADE